MVSDYLTKKIFFFRNSWFGRNSEETGVGLFEISIRDWHNREKIIKNHKLLNL